MNELSVIRCSSCFYAVVDITVLLYMMLLYICWNAVEYGVFVVIALLLLLLYMLLLSYM